jgi:hypothetical protein
MGSRSWWSALGSDWPNGIAFKDDEESVLRALETNCNRFVLAQLESVDHLVK